MSVDRHAPLDPLDALQAIALFARLARVEITSVDQARDVLRVVEQEARCALPAAPEEEERREAPATAWKAGARETPVARVTREKAIELLHDPPPLVERMRVFDLLRLVPELGHDGTRALLRTAGIGEQRRVGTLALRGETLVLVRRLREDQAVAS